MDISRESLIKIKELLSLFKNKKYDYEVIAGIITILRNDSLFDNPIYTEKVISDYPAYEFDGVVYISDNIFNYTSNIINKYKLYPGYNECEAYNYILLEILFHELAHLNQLDIALKRKSKYEIINDLYYLVFFEGHKDQEYYEKNSNLYVHEYNANIEALRILKALFNSKFLEYLNNYQLKKVLNNYYDNSNKIFISERIFDLKNIKDNGIIKVYDNIPTNIRISNGLPIKEKELSKIDNMPLSKIRKKYNL